MDINRFATALPYVLCIVLCVEPRDHSTLCRLLLGRFLMQ